MARNRWFRIGMPALVGALMVAACGKPEPLTGMVSDEAQSAGRQVASFPAAEDDYFREMDQNSKGVVALSREEAKGRNTWIVWSGGNDRFWDTISVRSAGALDFLKTLSSYDPERDAALLPEKKARVKGKYKFSRDNRWSYLGLVNEPCFEKATGPDPEHFGLWLDKRRADCPPDPFESEKKYAGVTIGGRGKTQWQGKTLPVGSYYGYASGIVGLRLFPNPDFDDAAAKRWDPVRYYNDPDYYNSKDLVKPYRVGMSCGFCHVGPSPIKPPADPENPKWENLSSNVGAQYFWVDRIFVWEADPTSFVYQLFHTSRPGALDTSLVSTDNINNPRTMNAVYGLKARLEHAKRWGRETLAGGGLDNKQFNNFVPPTHWLAQYFEQPATVFTPRVLKDGSDSVGGLGALNRVFLNIGLFSEEWLLHFNALVGGKPTTPIRIRVAREKSTYWQATESQTPDMALFFLKTTSAHKLKDAPGGEAYLSRNAAQLTRGKEVFAERCARCHSSKIPTPAVGMDSPSCNGPGYLDCWNRYWEWTKTDAFKKQMRQIVMAGDFLDNNFLSTELRVPVTLLETNACSPLATNAIEDNIWDNFSSRSYKDLPSVGEITVYHPVTGAPVQYKMPAGGRGYTRPASLISLWSTAPFLLNNTVGRLNPTAPNDDYNPPPTVEKRMAAFQDGIEKMLWPEKREKDSVLNKLPGIMDRTKSQTFIRVTRGYLPKELQELRDLLDRWLPWIFRDGGIEIGPIPSGTPINLLANVNLLSESSDRNEQSAHNKQVLELLLKAKHDLKSLPRDATDDQAKKVFDNLVDPLFNLSKCKDFIVNRGHYFGTDAGSDNFKKLTREPGLSDEDKRALIEFLKTF